jgi:hypothetical protein
MSGTTFGDYPREDGQPALMPYGRNDGSMFAARLHVETRAGLLSSNSEGRFVSHPRPARDASTLKEAARMGAI